MGQLTWGQGFLGELSSKCGVTSCMLTYLGASCLWSEMSLTPTEEWKF